MPKGVLSAVLVALLALLGGAASAALPAGGGVFGTVTDTEGHLLAAAEVVVKGPDSQVQTTTDERGRFRFKGLRPGSYHLKVHRDGFSEAIYSPLTVRVGRLTTVKVQLAETVEEILVVATEPAVTVPLPPSEALSGGEIARIGAQNDPFAPQGPEMARVSTVPSTGEVGSEKPAGRWLDSPRLEVDAASGESAFVATSPRPLSLITAEGRSATSFDAEVSVADRSWQNISSVDGVALADGDAPSLATPGRVDNLLAWAVDGSVSLWDDRLWFWGGYQRRELEGTALGGLPQEGELEYGSLEAGLRISDGNHLSLSVQHGDRQHVGVGASTDRELESTQIDESPSRWTKLEDSHVFGGEHLVTLQLFENRNALGLTPSGDGDVFLGADGVWRGGWLARREESESQGGQIETAWALRGRRGLHEVRAGWRSREISSFQLERWGHDNVVFLAGENYGTPFDLVRLHRSGDLSLDREQTAGWVQDRWTFSGVGEWSLDMGLRFDRQSGRSLGGSVSSHPLMPELLPAVDDPGGSGVELSDLLPRLSAAWTPGDAWNTTLRWGWARYASRLRDDLLERVSPLASSEIVLGFEDRDADRRIDGAEPFIILDRDGADFLAQPLGGIFGEQNLQSELTEEVHFGLATQPSHATEVRLDVVRRETSRVHDALRLVSDGQGVRVAQVDDYRLDTILTGRLPDGTPYSAPIYTLRDGLEFTGGSLIRNGGRRQVYEAVTLGWTRRLSGGFMVRAQATWNDWRWRVNNTFAALDDPTNSALGDLDGADDDGAAVARVGADDRWIHGRWSFDLFSTVQIAPNSRWGFDISAHVHAREGYPLPYSLSVVSEDRLREVQVTSEIDSYRLEDVVTLDMRLEKAVRLAGTEAVLSLDIYNLFDEGYVLERETRLSSPQGDAARASLSPRVVQLGLRWSLR